MMELNELIIKAIVELRTHGLSYGGTIGYHAGWCDDVADKLANALALIRELAEEKRNLEYTLAGVMHSVDKWLDGAELEQDEVNRAAKMREKTLQIVEKLTDENERLHASYTELERKCASLNDENERLRDELTKRPPKLIITKLSKKESKNV